MGFRLIRRALGFENGLCDRARRAADELSRIASELREKVAIHERAPDPFASLLGTMWNNHGDQKFFGSGIDEGKSQVYRSAPSNGRP